MIFCSFFLVRTAASGKKNSRKNCYSSNFSQVEILCDNLLVEESRNQVTVKRGPLVYCLESPDLKGAGVFDCAISSNASFVVEDMVIGNSKIKTLKTNLLLVNNEPWEGQLYREINTQKKTIRAKLIPYYAWANRGKTDMTVWLPLVR